MRRLRGLKGLVHDAVDHTVDLVEDGHESSSRAVMRVLSRAGPLAAPAAQVDGARRLITGGVLGSIKGINRLVAQVTDAGLDLLDDGRHDEPLVPLRSDAMGAADWLADAAIGAANGVVGDHIGATDNGLDLGMRLRSLDRWIEPDGRGMPADAGPRAVLLVHGLATTEWSWCLDAQKHLGDPAANFGTLLRDELGFTPIYARYNSGRHISQNGRALAERLEGLVDAWPQPLEELLLLGHSMGGLVLRSALHLAHDQGMRWPTRVRRIITLGSPLQGAPLEKFGNIATAVLAAVDLPSTRIPARLINGRSAGIKDLRYGYVQDGEWQDRDPDAVAIDGRLPATLPPGVAWCFIAATVADSATHPVSHAIGDLLVRVQSASGPQDAPPVLSTHHVGGVHHAAVQVHPAVFGVMREFLEG